MDTLNRLDPTGPPGAYQTYAIRQSPDRAVRAACEQVGCEQWLHGWETHIDEAADLGRAQAAFIRAESGRTFTEHRTAAGVTVFRFEPRQRCFADHKTAPQRFGVVAGDHRRRFGDWRIHTNGSDWVEDFGEHQDRIAQQIERG